MHKVLILFFLVSIIYSDIIGKQSGDLSPASINVALRSIGHEMLLLSGDSSSTLAPILKVDENQYQLRIDVPINYDTLPHVLDHILKSVNIDQEYIVVIKPCHSDTIVLGYDSRIYERGRTPCVGRAYKEECSLILLTFPKQDLLSSNNLLFAGIFFLLVGLIAAFKYKASRTPHRLGNDTMDEEVISLGASTFDVRNQTIKSSNFEESLTYRENKLLTYLAENQNQVLPREKIVSEVWGSEGVIVGRSLDMFISRLRKILKHDPNLQIKNIHGVGYRLEVSNLK